MHTVHSVHAEGFRAELKLRLLYSIILYITECLCHICIWFTSCVCASGCVCVYAWVCVLYLFRPLNNTNPMPKTPKWICSLFTTKYISIFNLLNLNLSLTLFSPISRKQEVILNDTLFTFLKSFLISFPLQTFAFPLLLFDFATFTFMFVFSPQMAEAFTSCHIISCFFVVYVFLSGGVWLCEWIIETGCWSLRDILKYFLLKKHEHATTLSSLFVCLCCRIWLLLE